MHEQREWFLGMKSTPSEDAVKIVEMTKRFRTLYKFTDKAMAGLETVDSYFERSSTVGKMLSNSIGCYRGISHERRVDPSISGFQLKMAD